MTNKVDLIEYDSAIFLDNEELIALYLEKAKKEGEEALREALATVARAKDRVKQI